MWKSRSERFTLFVVTLTPSASNDASSNGSKSTKLCYYRLDGMEARSWSMNIAGGKIYIYINFCTI